MKRLVKCFLVILCSSALICLLPFCKGDSVRASTTDDNSGKLTFNEFSEAVILALSSGSLPKLKSLVADDSWYCISNDIQRLDKMGLTPICSTNAVIISTAIPEQSVNTRDQSVESRNEELKLYMVRLYPRLSLPAGCVRNYPLLLYFSEGKQGLQIIGREFPGRSVFDPGLSELLAFSGLSIRDYLFPVPDTDIIDPFREIELESKQISDNPNAWRCASELFQLPTLPNSELLKPDGKSKALMAQNKLVSGVLGIVPYVFENPLNWIKGHDDINVNILNDVCGIYSFETITSEGQTISMGILFGLVNGSFVELHEGN